MSSCILLSQMPSNWRLDLLDKNACFSTEVLEQRPNGGLSRKVVLQEQESVCNTVRTSLYTLFMERKPPINKGEVIRSLPPDVSNDQKCYVVSKLRYEQGSVEVIRDKWRLIVDQACYNCSLNPHSFDTFSRVSNVCLVWEELQTIIAAANPKGVRLKTENEHVPGADVQNLMQWLIGELPLTRHIFSAQCLKTILLDANQEFLQRFRFELQSALTNLIHYQERTYVPPVMVEMIHSQLLALFAFSEPPTGTLFYIPFLGIEGWEERAYVVARKPLTPETLGSSIDMLVLEPLEMDEEASPIIIFRGTTYPSAPGSLLARFVDFVPGKSVGKVLYDMGRDTINTTIDMLYQKYGKQVKIYGQSLGGTLAIFSALERPKKVFFYSTAPAGVLSSDLIGQEQIQGKIWYSIDDDVPKVGFLPVGEKVQQYLVDGETHSSFSSHACLLGKDSNTLILRVEGAAENRRFFRYVMTAAHQAATIPAVLLYGGSLAIKVVVLQVCSMAIRVSEIATRYLKMHEGSVSIESGCTNRGKPLALLYL